MGDFRTRYPAEASELDDSIAAAEEYRQMHDRVAGDDLPRFESEFKESLNKNTIPDDPRSPFVTSGVRIGTPSTTTQGMREGEMGEIAGLIARALRGRGDDSDVAAVREDVTTLCSKFTPY